MYRIFAWCTLKRDNNGLQSHFDHFLLCGDMSSETLSEPWGALHLLLHDTKFLPLQAPHWHHLFSSWMGRAWGLPFKIMFPAARIGLIKDIGSSSLLAFIYCYLLTQNTYKKLNGIILSSQAKRVDRKLMNTNSSMGSVTRSWLLIVHSCVHLIFATLRLKIPNKIFSLPKATRDIFFRGIHPLALWGGERARK